MCHQDDVPAFHLRVGPHASYPQFGSFVAMMISLLPFNLCTGPGSQFALSQSWGPTCNCPRTLCPSYSDCLSVNHSNTTIPTYFGRFAFATPSFFGHLLNITCLLWPADSLYCFIKHQYSTGWDCSTHLRYVSKSSSLASRKLQCFTLFLSAQQHFDEYLLSKKKKERN